MEGERISTSDVDDSYAPFERSDSTATFTYSAASIASPCSDSGRSRKIISLSDSDEDDAIYTRQRVSKAAAAKPTRKLAPLDDDSTPTNKTRRKHFSMRRRVAETSSSPSPDTAAEQNDSPRNSTALLRKVVSDDAEAIDAFASWCERKHCAAESGRAASARLRNQEQMASEEALKKHRARSELAQEAYRAWLRRKCEEATRRRRSNAAEEKEERERQQARRHRALSAYDAWCAQSSSKRRAADEKPLQCDFSGFGFASGCLVALDRLAFSPIPIPHSSRLEM